MASANSPVAAARDDPDAVDLVRAGVPDEGLLAEGGRAALAQLGESDSLGRATDEADPVPLVLGKGLRLLQAELRADERVVSDLGMGIERHVIGGERDVGLEERL